MTIFKEFVFFFALAILVGVFTVLALNEAFADQGEPLGQHKGWAAHPSLGVVLQYEMEGYEAFYAHPLMFQGPVKECQGIMGKVEQCQPFQVVEKMGMIVLMTDDVMPVAYGAQIEATHKKINNSNYTALVGVTFKGAE